jgi:hypothetical protein
MGRWQRRQVHAMRRNIMNQSISSKPAPSGRSGKRGRNTPRGSAVHPRSAPIISPEAEADQELDQPFVEGAHDAIDPDLRHRMISEVAYHRYTNRGYADGYDVDDWLQAEAEVDHLLLNPPLLGGSQ